eukprot:CAMPEP_0175329546 /NCGR_PEP_ID=MMETSP0095-20121207/256_1 /TAXON_ID=311494 /ORGANISM="Alexandrium monilatum, Strain CCMP3105" /LENGTH=96 /DNA_ID=CAMNT_0016626683 /DNA_START=1 /DNA_END=291 /DNA_ORIENTATION=+
MRNTTQRVEVLVHSVPLYQAADAVADALRFPAGPVAREASRQKPVGVDPDGPPPVVPGVERGLVGGQCGQRAAVTLAAEGPGAHQAQEARHMVLPC